MSFFKINIQELFQSVHLPYEYVHIPDPEDPKEEPSVPLYYYVNRVISTIPRKVLHHCGFVKTEDKKHWNVSWGRQFTCNEYRECESWQKINHWAGAFLIGRKDDLTKRMQELRSRVGNFVDFYPESYLMPESKEELMKNWEKHNTWIIKPSASARGRGIHLMSSAEKCYEKNGVVQYYLENPFLITGRKFDLRLYVLVTSISPLKIYIHENGLVRFATHPYESNGNIDDLKMHLTNFSLNKTDSNFIQCTDDEESVQNSKWSFQFFLKYLKSQSYDTDKLLMKIKRATSATLIAGFSKIREYHRQYVKHRYTSYEMYGIDIILDNDLNPYILEVNVSPALNGIKSKLDLRLKSRILHELFRMARIIKCDATSPEPCKGIDYIDQLCNDSLTQERVSSVENGNVNPWDSPVFADFMFIRDYIEEQSIKGGFQLIFPTKDTFHEYLKCFDKVEYSDIVLTKWVEMDPQHQLSVLESNWEKYSIPIQQFPC